MTWMQPPADGPHGSPAPSRLGDGASGFGALLAAGQDGVAAEDDAGRVYFANETLLQLLGLGSPQAFHETRFEQALSRFGLFDASGAPVRMERLPGPLARRGQQPAPVELLMRGEQGEERWISLTAVSLSDVSGARQVLHLVRDITGHRRAVRGLEIIAEASTLLATSLDYMETIPRLVQQLIPELADGCTVELLDEDGIPRPAAAHHAYPGQQEAADELRRRYPEATERFFSEVLRSGQPQLTPRISTELLGSSAVDEEHLRLMQALAMRASLTVPLSARGRTLGVLNFVCTRSGRDFDDAALALARELACRIALAIDDARLIEELQRSEERLHLALREGRMWYVESDASTGQTSFSPSLGGILGKGVPSSSQALLDDLHPEDAPRVRAQMQRLHSGESERESFGYRLLDAEGQIHFIEGVSTLIRDRQGQPHRTIGVRLDVSERKQAEETLRQNDERLRLVVDAGRIGFFDQDLRTGRALLSPTAELMLGIAPGTYDGTFESFLRCIHPDDLEPTFRAIEEQIARQDEAQIITYRSLDATGTVRWLEAHARTLCDADGQPVRTLGVIMDVTQRKKAEESLRQSEERLRLVMNAGQIGFYDLDWATGKVISSPSYEAILGLTPGAHADTADVFLALIHPGDRERIDRLTLEYAASNVRTSVVEYRILRANDGAVRWLEIHSQYLRNEKGQIVRLLGAVLDITERKETAEQGQKLAAEQAARAESENARKRLAAILDSISEPLLTVDETWHLRFMNRPAQDLVGDARVGARAPEVAPFRDAPALLARCEDAMRRGGLVEQELELRDGRWYEARACRYDEGLSVYLRDITARKREQEVQLRLAEQDALRADIATTLATEPDGRQALQRCAEALVRRLGVAYARIWILDPAGKVLEKQADAGPLDGREDGYARIPMGQTVVGFIASERKPYSSNNILEDPLLKNRARARREGVVAFAGYPLMSGQELFGVLALFSARPLRNDTLAMLGPLVDAIAYGLGRRRAEQALAERAAQLARSNSELEQFAYVASHDLQEPLRVIASFTQLLAQRYQGNFDEKADRYTHFVVDAAARMQRLIQDLLAYSRVGTQARELTPVQGSLVLQRALANLQAAAAEANAEVTHDALPTVYGDEIQLEQLLQNLIGNALKFRGDTPPRVHVSAQRTGAEWRIAVKDNGIGIAPQHTDRIFVIFQRLHGKGRYSGTGIGLAICKKIVERHGGRIWVESTPGQGSTFFFTLQAAPAT